MAYRRSMIARAKTFYQHQPRFAPSLSHITSDSEEFPTKTTSADSEIFNRFLRNRNNSGNSSLLSGNSARIIRSKIPASYGLIFHRKISNVPSDNQDLDFNGAAGAVGDKAVEAAPVVREVAIAAADSFAPVAAFQYLIDYVHCYTGFEWWASITATTFLIRFIGLPHLINTKKILNSHAYQVEKQQSVADIHELICILKSKNHSESDYHRALAILEEQRKIFCALLLNALADLMNLGSACFLFFAILNMAENIPSFAIGGTLWFTDLTTPDHSLRLPVLFALTFWFRIESNRRLVQPGNNVKIKNIVTPSLVSLVTVIAGLPSAIYCYWISSNLFSIAFLIAMMNPRVRKLLGITLRPSSSSKKI